MVLAWEREVHPDLERVNVNGGAIALGHPLGCSGARLTATLLCELERRGDALGLQTMCEGGGMANALSIDRAACQPRPARRMARHARMDPPHRRARVAVRPHHLRDRRVDAAEVPLAPPAEPDPDDIQPVNLRFRCIVCGAEVTMTAAQDDEPEAPRALPRGHGASFPVEG